MGKKNSHKWKQFCKLIEAPYRKRFSTDWGDFKIDNRGIYSYAYKTYECYDENIIYADMFINGNITIEEEKECLV